MCTAYSKADMTGTAADKECGMMISRLRKPLARVLGMRDEG